MKKLCDRIQNIPIKVQNPSMCWFENSEQILIAQEDGFQILNVLKPQKPVLKVDCALMNNYQICPPKVTFEDRIVILIRKDWKLIFYDVQRQKFVFECKLA